MQGIRIMSHNKFKKKKKIYSNILCRLLDTIGTSIPESSSAGGHRESWRLQILKFLKEC